MRTVEDSEAVILADDTESLLELVEGQEDKLTTVRQILFLSAQHSRPNCLRAVSEKHRQEIVGCGNDVCQKFSGNTPLSLAATKDNTEVIRFLLDHGAKPLICTAQGYSPLELSCERSAPNIEVVGLLLGATMASIDLSNIEGVTLILYKAFVEAALRAAVDVVKLFIKEGVPVNLNLDDDIGSPLYNAIESGCMEVVDAILDAGADIEAQRRCIQQTPLMKAAEVGNLPALRRLLSAGADINRQSMECSSALVLACFYGHINCVNFLLEQGGNPKLKNSWGFSALFLGADTPAVLNRLVQEDIDLDEIVGERGEAAVHLLTVIGCVPSLQVLLDAGANINTRTSWNETLTWLAAWKGHTDVSRYVIQRNCELDVPSHGCHVWAWEYLPVEVALGICNPEIPRMLINAGCSLKNDLYFSENDPGPLEEIPWVKLRKEVLLFLQDSEKEYEWFVNFVRNPRSLKDVCRLSIRRILKTPLFKKVNILPLPPAVKSYLKFEDL